jgi:two-component system phosphate regulon response regulator OmpR
MSNGQILIVDDDASVRAMLADYLSSHGYAVAQAEAGEAMRAEIERSLPDIVLLDIRMPGEDGLSLVRYLRSHYDVGIIMVTASGELVDRVVGLEVGADDYVTKPFDPRELLARVKSVMRRLQARAPADAPAQAASQTVRMGRCRLDLDSHRLLDDTGADIPMTAMEFDLLRVFASHPNRVLSRDQLLTLTRNREWEPFDRSIDIRIARLRRKIEADPEKPQAIRTVRSAGYMFVPGKTAGPHPEP